MTHAMTLAAVLLAAGPWLLAAARHQTPEASFAQLRARGHGLDLYIEHCATCHGRSGRGDGPQAADLTARPSDLTRLAERNGGTFPAGAVTRVIDGGDRAHRGGEMPRWGDVFRSGGGDAAAKERLEALTLYVEFMQARPPRR
jgi:mono/diheme cytochrome c family protein